MVFKYINNKKRAKGNDRHGTKQEEAEKAELLNAIFASVFNDNSSPLRIFDPQDQGTEILEGRFFLWSRRIGLEDIYTLTYI